MKDYLDGIDHLPDSFIAVTSSDRIKHAVYSYFMDVIRYKEFHFNSYDGGDIHDNKINNYKIAAFTIKWILKVKPIFITPPKDYETNDKENAEINLINEQFCFSHALDILKIPADSLTPEVHDSFIYHLHYRNFDEATFFLLLETLDKSCKR